MSKDNIELTENQKWWVDLMLKGMGLSAAKKEFTKSERKEIEQLIELGIAEKGKNYTGDKIGMYHIPDEKREKIRNLLNKTT